MLSKYTDGFEKYDTMSGLQCEYCLKHYARTTDLLNHVEYSRLCWSFYRERGVRVNLEPGVNSKKANLQRQVLKDPFMQAEGPKCIVTLSSAEGTSEADQAHYDAWMSCVEQHTGDDSLLEGLRLARPSHFLYHEEILQAFRQWTDQLVESETLTLDAFSRACVWRMVSRTAQWRGCLKRIS